MQGIQASHSQVMRVTHLRCLAFLALAALPLKAGAVQVNVDIGVKHQSISGFGASSAWESNISDNDADLLWSTTKGAGLSLHRIMINADGTTSELANAQKATTRGAKVWGSPWNNNYSTAFQNGNCTDHHLDFSKAKDWANAIVNLSKTMKAAGAPLYAVSSQNEPNMPCENPGSYYSASEIVNWVGNYLGPALESTGVKLITPETVNWYAFPEYKTAILADANAKKYTSILATHEYGGTVTAYPEVAAAGKEFWETEVYDLYSNKDDPGMTSALHVQGYIHEALTVANMNAWHFWWVYPCSGSSCGNGGLWNQGTGAGPSKRLWIMGNYSRFVRPGYVRIDAPANPAPGVKVSAFYGAADNRVVVVAADTNFSSASVNVALSGGTPDKVTPWLTDDKNALVAQAAVALSGTSFSYTLPARSVTSFVIDLKSETPVVTALGTCDIYQAGGTPCVAAYSTTRALYGAYNGSLYQVRRSDNSTKDIGVLAAGGIAEAAAQDAFCTGSSCTISKIYDQSGKANHLTKAPGGSKDYGPNDDVEAVADALPIQLGGQKVYGLHVVGSPSWTSTGQVGYRNTATSGIAKGDDPESMYMVTDGTYTNGACCFDFGNAEMTPVAGGYGTMEALYFGTNDWWDKGAGSGPWIMADLEVGVYSKGGTSAYSDANKSGDKVNAADILWTFPFVTAMLKGNSAKAIGGGPFTLKGGNAQSGKLTTIWDGAYPVGYSPMNRQGGIVLGVGGDNSSMAHGNFYEGVLTTGYASAATDSAVQANIVAAGYGSSSKPVSVHQEFHAQPNAALHHDPFSAEATLSYSLEQSGRVNVQLVDFAGRSPRRVFDGEQASGKHQISWSLGNLPAGLYVVRLSAEGQNEWVGRLVVGK